MLRSGATERKSSHSDATATARRAVINKLLALAFVALVLGKLLFRPQLKAVGRWLDGAVNAMLIAIAIAYSLQLALVLFKH